MTLLTRSNYFFAHYFWNNLPAPLQKIFSWAWSYLYKTSLSKFLILVFIKRYRIHQDQFDLYKPASGHHSYLSFQDFFTRRLKQNLNPKFQAIAPCEGVVCSSGLIQDLDQVEVKGQHLNVKNIFGDLGNKISPSHSFINIFLHNHNYHRFHSPVTGTIKNKIRIPGQLNFLRPWLYTKKQVSEPALKNERVVFEIEDQQQRSWFIAFIGGMGVGTIQIYDQFDIGSLINCGDEIGLFLLGSTCCLAIPKIIKSYKYLEKIKVGDPL